MKLFLFVGLLLSIAVADKLTTDSEEDVMEKIVSEDQVKELIEKTTAIQEELHQLKIELVSYLSFISKNNLHLNTTAPIDEKIGFFKHILTHCNEIGRHRISLSKDAYKLKKTSEEVIEVTNKLLEFGTEDEDVDEVNDLIVYQILEYENEKCDEIKTNFRHPVPKNLRGIIDGEEKKQLEEWTGLKCSEVLFDSDKDDWDTHDVLNERVMNKSHLAFIIEDEGNNKFGGYLSATINRVYTGQWNESNIPDPNAFLFSMKSNGRLNGMMKFENKDTKHTFILNDRSNWLFLFGSGNDIVVSKQSNKSSSSCTQSSYSSYEYHGIQNALCGQRYFTPKRITVIQMK